MPLQNDIHLNPPQLLKSYPLLPLQTASPGIIARTSTQAKSGYFAKIILQLRIFPWICMHITKPALPNHYQQFFFVPYFNLCANQPSKTLQDLWMLASVTFHCHELRFSIVWNVNICTRGFASSFDINHIVFLLQACLRTWMGWSWLFDQCSFKGSFDCVIIQLDNE